MKHLPIIVLTAAALSAANAAVPQRWTVETSRLQPVVFDAVRGETLALEASFQSYGTPLSMAGKDVRIFWQTNGMGRLYWNAPATVRSAPSRTDTSTPTNVIAATFTPAMDPGSPTVTGFLGSTGDIYRAAFTIRYRNGPGATPNALPLPTQTIDCATTTFLHPEAAPFGGGSHGVDTNAVRDIASSASLTNAGAVAAAQAMTNGQAIVRTDRIVTSPIQLWGQTGIQMWNDAKTKWVYLHGNNPTDKYTVNMPAASGTLVVDADVYTKSEVNTISNGAVTAAKDYATQKANTAESNAKSYSDDTFVKSTNPDNPNLKLIWDSGSLNFTGDGYLYADCIRAPWSQIYYNNGEYSLEDVLDDKANASDVYTKTAADDAFATKATESHVTSVSNKVDALTGYITGDRVRLSVTNFYGNTSGEPPRLRIEEFDHSTTNVVGGQQVVSNFYRVVWDEVTRQTNYYARVNEQFIGLSNNVVSAAWRQTNNQLANKAPRAWGDVTSSGEAAPPNTVWHTAPNTVFAGGTEYAHVAVGAGAICVLTEKGAPVYTEGEDGQFRFMDDSGQNYFGFDVRSSYTVGCRTDGISVNNALHTVSLTYDLTSSSPPEILTCTNLLTGTWSTVTDVEWDQNPPAGTQICYINVGTNPQGFYKAQFSYAAGSKFITNMMADLSEGIAATNESGITTAAQLPVYPVITTTGVVWRVKWGSNQ